MRANINVLWHFYSRRRKCSKFTVNKYRGKKKWFRIILILSNLTQMTHLVLLDHCLLPDSLLVWNLVWNLMRTNKGTQVWLKMLVPICSHVNPRSAGLSNSLKSEGDHNPKTKLKMIKFENVYEPVKALLIFIYGFRPVRITDLRLSNSTIWTILIKVKIFYVK